MSTNGAHPPGTGGDGPRWARLTAGNLPCAGFGCAGLLLFLLVLYVGLSHPLGTIVAGIVIMAVFGAALVIWRD